MISKPYIIYVYVFVLTCGIFAYCQSSPAVDQKAVLRAHTDLVLVPVIVTDENGNHVQGLSKDLFSVEEDGKKQRIATFEEIHARSTPVDRPSSPANVFTNRTLLTDGPKGLTIIAVDLINTGFTDQNSARDAILHYLGNSIVANQLVSLLVIRSNNVQIIHDFSSDSSSLIAALKKVEQELPAVNRNDKDAYSGKPTDMPGIAPPPVAGTDIADPIIDAKAQALLTLLLAHQKMARISENRAAEATIEAFRQIANYFSAVPGRKSLIWVTDGFPFSILANASGPEISRIPKELYEHVIQLLDDAQISVYPVDVKGLVPPSVVERNYGEPQGSAVIDNSPAGISFRSNALSSIGASNSQQDSLETMRSFAALTGGLPSYNSNDIAGLIGRASQDSSEYYWIGYYRSDNSKPGWHQLRVNVAARGVHVRARPGYFSKSLPRDAAEIKRSDERSALLSSLDSNALPFSMEWREVERVGLRRKVVFNIEVAGQIPNIDATHNNGIDFDFIAIAFDLNGKKAGQTMQNWKADLNSQSIKQIRAHGLTYQNTLELTAGQYRVRFIVRDNLSGKLGSVTAYLNAD